MTVEDRSAMDDIVPLIGTHISALEQRIVEDNSPGNTDGLLAHHILAATRMPFTWAIDPTSPGRLASAGVRADASTTAQLGYAAADFLDPAVAGLQPRIQQALTSLSHRDPLRDRLSFLYAPGLLVGISLAAASLAQQQPDSGAWLRNLLLNPAYKPADGFHNLIKEYCLALLTGQPARLFQPETLTAPDELAAARWIISTGHAQLVDTTATRELDQRTLRAILRADITRYSAPRCAVLLRSLTEILDASVDQLVLRRSHLSLVLGRFEAAMRRWRWDPEDLQKPIRWPVPSEREVQDILWLILRSVFDDVKDEETLPKIGHHSFRADFGLPRLKTLIEVKYIRKATDFEKVEKEVREDVVGYLSQTDLYKDIIAFIYDDSASVEHHDLTRQALLGIPEISEVIIVSRPGALAGTRANATPRPRKRASRALPPP